MYLQPALIAVWLGATGLISSEALGYIVPHQQKTVADQDVGSSNILDTIVNGDHAQVTLGAGKTTDHSAAWSKYSPTSLSVNTTGFWQSKVLEDPKNRLALSALSKADARDILTQTTAAIADQHVFNVKIPMEGSPITDQKSSGRCWIFAALNVFRVDLMKKYSLSSFELSQNYLFFWDKLEKSNYFLENILSTADQDLDSRLVQTLLAEPISDGGQWDMLVNLVGKYGLAPKSVYPESFNSRNSQSVNSILKSKLREYAIRLRNLVKSKEATPEMLSEAKQEMMREVHLMLVVTLGPPPSPTENFEWDFIDGKGKAHTLRMTPLDLAEGLNSLDSGHTEPTISNMVSLVDDPRHEYNTLMTVNRLGNVVGGRGITYINVPMHTMKEACVKMLMAGRPIFFGSDVGKFLDRREGIMDLEVIDYRIGFNIGLFELNKADRLRSSSSAMTHAMVLTGVHLDEDGNPIRWRVQNSWGVQTGHEGWYVMTDAWMDQYVYQAVIDPEFLSRDVVDVLKQKPLELPLWDPMGSLAC